jgi:hypothetical protein
VRRAVAATAAAVVMAIAGCGSSALSDKQLRADATRVCTITRTRTNRIAVPSSPAGGERFLRGGTAALKPELRALRGLTPPTSVSGRYDGALSALAVQLETLEAASASLHKGGDPLQIFPLLARKLAPLEVRANGAWTSLQIPACIER